MKKTRKQLILFLNEPNGPIEKIRAAYNPIQFHLIPAHVTFCREDEIEPVEETLERIKSISLEQPTRIEFDKAERFPAGKGVYLLSSSDHQEFNALRKLEGPGGIWNC